jgi:[ribosomal protein S18]-alanine N-acetyltransferase
MRDTNRDTNPRFAQLAIKEMPEESHVAMRSWRYPPPYDFYDGDIDPPSNPERFFVALDRDRGLVGFYYFEQKPPDLDYGLGLRPDLVGQGLGLDFFTAGLAFAHERYEPRRVYLHVAEFNERARRVYERAGFEVVSRHVRSFERFGKVPFLTMAERAGSPAPGDAGEPSSNH